MNSIISRLKILPLELELSIDTNHRVFLHKAKEVMCSQKILYLQSFLSLISTLRLVFRNERLQQIMYGVTLVKDFKV